MFKDAYRNAHRLGVPIAAPATHPFNPLLPLRVSALPLEPSARKALIDALYRATWSERRRVDQADVVLEVAREVGLAEDIVAAAQSDENKARLRENTERAVAAGAWGVPTIIVEGELFRGLDSLPHLETFLRGGDPIPKDAFARWGDLQPSASRLVPPAASRKP